MDVHSRALLEAIRAVLNEYDFKRIINRIMTSAKELLSAEAASLFLVNRKLKRLEMAASTNLPSRVERRIHFPMGIGVAGWVAATGESVNLEDITKDPRHYREVARQTGFKTRGYLCVPLKVGGNVLGTLQVLNHTKGGRFSPEDRELLEAFSVVASLAIKKCQMHEVALEKRRMQMELEVAEAFQRKMLPLRFDPPSGLRIAGFNRPARRMGGDIYDGFALQNGYCVLLGDVSGKGPGAALWMASLSSLLHFLADQGKDPLNEIEVLDRHLSTMMPTGTFITMFIGTFRNDQLYYSSAGHNPMLLVNADGEFDWLDSTCLPLGVMPEMPCAIRSIPFSRGDRLILFSDGVTEAWNSKGEMYGEKRLLSLARRHGSLSPKEFIDRIHRSLKRFSAGVPQSDDITILVVEAE